MSIYAAKNKENVRIVAETIGVPVDAWPGNCYAIACKMVEAGALADIKIITRPENAPKVRYGHWLGPVAAGSMFAGRPLVSHGWIEIPSESLPGGLIVDPTRFVFDGREPYIYLGINDHYDLGGSQLRDAMRDPSPPCHKQAHIDYPDDVQLGVFLRQFVGCSCPADALTTEQLFWLGNANPDDLYPHCEEFYCWMADHERQALIPLDYWTYIME
jgi:hypothetical protein